MNKSDEQSWTKMILNHLIKYLKKMSKSFCMA